MTRTGRPSTYTHKLADRICTHLASGKSLRRICRSIEGMPTETTVYKWLRQHPDFAENYTRARQDGADAEHEELHEWERLLIAGKLDPQAARVAIDSRKWRLARKFPKKYGDRVSVDQTVKATVRQEPKIADPELRRQAGELYDKLTAGTEN